MYRDVARKTVGSIIILMTVGLVASVSVQDFDTFSQSESQEVFQAGEEITFRAEVEDSTNANLTVTDPEGTRVLDSEPMNLVSNNTAQVYQYNYSVDSNSTGGNWRASVNITGQGSAEISSEGFHIATDAPHFLDIAANPFYVLEGNNVTITANITDSGEDLDSVNTTFLNSSTVVQMDQIAKEGSIHTYEASRIPEQQGSLFYQVEAEDSTRNTNSALSQFVSYGSGGSSNVSVTVAPSCQSSLDYFLLPGNGEIVQNKTGVFVEILSNSGNVESNITVEYLNVTYEGDEAWGTGEPIGPVIRSYSGEIFPYIRLGEAVTYFKLFKASEPLGNYTARSEVASRCLAEGPQNETVQKDNINSSYKCGNLSSPEFQCFNTSVVDYTLSTAEVDSVNFTDTTSKTVDDQVTGSTAYKNNFTLNATDYDAYVFNTTSTSEYDYSCVSTDSAIDSESEECAYEGNTIDRYLIKPTDISFDGRNATYSLQEKNENLLNTSLDCQSIDSEEGRCDYSFRFLEFLDFFGNFEIVKGIGDQSGGVNESGNETTNQTIEGDEANPGQTPVPEPEPEPQPQPDPVVRLDIESAKEEYTTNRGQYVAANFTVTNLGNVPVSDISLVPEIERFTSNWSTRNAEIANLGVGQNVSRQIFVRPATDTSPGNYVVPVSGESGGEQLDLDYFTLEVREGLFLAEITIQESPRSLDVPVNSSNEIPLLIENTGRAPVTNVSGRIQNIGDCGEVSSPEIDRLQVNETDSLVLDLETAPRTASCNTTVVVSSEEGAFSFADLGVTVTPEPGLIPPGQRVPLIVLLWTGLLAAYGFATRKYELDTLLVKGPYVALIVGEVLLLLYMVVTYYSLPVASVLPF